MRNKRNQGFTLLEILVVVIITMILVTVLSGVFFSILKNSTKGRLMLEIKQNGSYALNTIERMIRNSKSVDDAQNNLITITNQDDGQTTFSCENGQISSNAASLINVQKVVVDSCSFTYDDVDKIRRVGVEFVLKQKEATGRPEEEAQMSFKSQITLRNF